MINIILRVFPAILLLILIPVDMGAGLNNPPSDSRARMVSHGLALPSGFELPEPDPVVTYFIDHNKVFPHPKSFEKPKDIMTKGQLPKNRLVSFVWMHNPKVSLELVQRLADVYVREATIEGVNYDIAFVQMCLETGFLRFNGDVRATQNNFCGLGATGNGEPGMSFPTLEDGVRAHIQHLKAYATTEPLANPPVASRIGMVKRGTATDYYQLTGRWATDPQYGKKIDMLLSRIYDGATPEPVKRKTSVLFD
ncbi:MAG TPA: glucosaminidase domain-containing protein [Bacteroidales bacterium]|nr:glucosaminidase domain-containing protein [Bacteroidales bacterium]